MIPGIPRAIRLLDLEEQAAVPVTLPNERTVDLHFLDGRGYQLLLEAQRTGRDADALAVLAHALPDATPEEIGLLTPKMVTHLVLLAARKIEYVTEVLEGNADGPPSPPSARAGGPAAPSSTSPPPRARPRTTSTTRSRGSGGSTAATGGPSSAGPTT